MDYSNMSIEQIETIEIIEWNLSEYWNQIYQYPENQFDLLFLDIQAAFFPLCGYTKLVYKN